MADDEGFVVQFEVGQFMLSLNPPLHLTPRRAMARLYMVPLSLTYCLTP
ncbi:hypothetical protein [Coleofasciculus chthonoplastes]|nr:hypothetical protein [Coleofasciculus chthonoplastes]